MMRLLRALVYRLGIRPVATSRLYSPSREAREVGVGVSAAIARGIQDGERAVRAMQWGLSVGQAQFMAEVGIDVPLSGDHRP